MLALAGLSLVGLPLRAAAVQERAIGVVDLHVDLSYQTSFKGRDPRLASGQFQADYLRAGGVVGAVLPLYVPHDVSPRGPRLEDLERSFQRLLRFLPRTEPYAPPGCQDRGRVRTWLAFEGAAPLGRDLEAIWRWARRGVRFYGLVHVHDNLLASSAGGSRHFRQPAKGLSTVGRELVRRIHATGGIIDVSHASDAAIADILRDATADAVPVVATHSNARALAHHPRNLSDEQARGIARTGGVIGVNFHSRFLVDTGQRATLADVVRHIRHLVRVAGVDHVAIGSDFEGGILPPAALDDARDYPALQGALLAAGMSRANVEKIFAKNALRLLCERRRPGCGARSRETKHERH